MNQFPSNLPQKTASEERTSIQQFFDSQPDLVIMAALLELKSMDSNGELTPNGQIQKLQQALCESIEDLTDHTSSLLQLIKSNILRRGAYSWAGCYTKGK